MKIIITIKILSLLGKTILNSIGLTEKVIQPKIEPIIEDHQFWLFKADLDNLKNEHVEIDVYLKKHGLNQVQGLEDYISNNKNIKQNSVNELIQAQNYQNIAKQAHGIKGVKKAIDEYNNSLTRLDNETTKVSSNTTKFTETLAGTNTKLANFMTNAKGSEITLGSYAKSLAIAKIKTIGLQAATMAMNMAMSMGISFLITKGISALASWIDSLVVTKEEIKEAAEEAKSAIDQIKSDFDSLSSSTDNIKKRFAELAQSVDNLGKANQSRGKLSTEDYNEFLDLSNQLSELFPQLTKGYDDNGNAILDLSGNVNTIVSSLENLVSVQQKLANQQILEKMPDVWSGYTSDLEGYNEEIKDAESEISNYKDALKELSILENDGAESLLIKDKNKEFLNKSFTKALNNIGIDPRELRHNEYEETSGYWESTTWNFAKLNEVQLSQLKDELASLISQNQDIKQLTKDKITAANSEMSSYINTWLSNDYGAEHQLTKMSSDMQNVVKDVLINSDWFSFLPDDIKEKKWDEDGGIADWLETKFLYAIAQIDNDKIQTALVNAFNDNFTVDTLQETIDQLLNTEGFDEDNPLIIYLQAKVKDKNEKVDAVKARVNSDLSEDELKEKINSLSDEDLSIAANISVTGDSLLSWDELIAKIEETKEQIKKNSITSFSDAFNSADFADSKEKLLELAKSGEITADVLESTAEYKTLLTQTGLSAEGAKLKILDMLTATEKLSAASKGMDSLSTAFNEWKDKGFVTAETLEALPEAFKKDTEKFDLFSQIVGDPTNSKAEIQQAFNDIATEYLKTQGTLGKITEENTESYIANLKDMGIANAEEVIEDYKTSKDEFDTLLGEAYEEWTSHLNDDEQALEEYLSATDTKNAELMNAFGEEYSTDYQNWLDLLQKKKDAYETYRAAIEGNLVQTPDEAKDTNKYWAKTDQLMNQHLADMNYYEYEDIQDEFEKYSAKLASTKFTSNSLDYTGSKDSSSSSSKNSSQTFDWIETKIKRLNDVLDSIKAKADNVYSSWTERNTELASAISNTKKAIDLQSQAYSRYIQEADSVGLSDNYKKLVQSGAIDISTISDETLKEKISDYQTW